jgi:energy-converting hydrogenase Eha subunit E
MKQERFAITDGAVPRPRRWTSLLYIASMFTAEVATVGLAVALLAKLVGHPFTFNQILVLIVFNTAGWVIAEVLLARGVVYQANPLIKWAEKLVRAKWVSLAWVLALVFLFFL